MDAPEDVLDDFFAYNYVMGDDDETGSSGGSGGGDGCLTWAIRLLAAYYVLRIIADLFS